MLAHPSLRTDIGAAWPCPLEIAIMACAAPGDWPALEFTNIARLACAGGWGPRRDSDDGTASTAPATLHLPQI